MGPVGSGDGVCSCDNISQRSACQSMGFWGRRPSLTQASLLSSFGPRPYRLAVCPLASSLCLPTWLAFSSGNKGGVQFWAAPDSSYPTPHPHSLSLSLFKSVSLTPLPPAPSLTPILSQADPLVLRGPFPQLQGEGRLRSLVGTPFFFHPPASIPVPNEAPEASLV